MKPFVCVTLLLGALIVRGADEPRSFSSTLSAADRQRLGLSSLSPAQLADLDSAVAAYARGGNNATERQTEQVAAAAVEDYKKKEEPGVIARALEVFKRKEEEKRRERFTAQVVGVFRGWKGGTYFPLADGQVWRQVGTDVYELPPVKEAEVEIYQSSNGYWRLLIPDGSGAWVTVKRVQ